MRYNIFKRIFLILALFFVFIQSAECANVLGTGRAVIEKGDLRGAAKLSLNNALINSIKSYYKNLDINGLNISDVSPEYLKFINNYKITSIRVVGSSVITRVSATIDESALNDATFLIDNPVNSSVFAFKGLPTNNLNNDAQTLIINNILNNNSFSTFEQKNFRYSMSDMTNFNSVNAAFETIDSKYLFEFSFDFKQNNLENIENVCELSTLTNIISKTEPMVVLKLDVGSSASNIKTCTTEVLTKSITSTIAYVRENVIEKPVKSNIVNNYTVRVINFKNIVSVNSLLSTLKERRLINDFKAISFSSKQMLINIVTPFTISELERKMSTISTDFKYSFKINGEEIVLDFDLIEPEAIKNIDNATVIMEKSL